MYFKQYSFTLINPSIGRAGSGKLDDKSVPSAAAAAAAAVGSRRVVPLSDVMLRPRPAAQRHNAASGS
ncbi:hypothetical protein JYU34_020035 [Plutella xylostella]|uniref:Uncharacterized protein n=1 Tax=Plutella xylostella TaxID=51655 RepID=A0ABQ7PWF7_PLUXY|nr:hypothetical protein JYU34_020035 [Plutella xylostella]